MRSPEQIADEEASLKGLGLAIKAIRVRQRLTRAAVARQGGLTGNTITHLEVGLKQQPLWGTLRSVAKGLGVDLDELIRLGLELAPGEAGDRLRREQRRMNRIDVEELAAKDETEEKPRRTAGKAVRERFARNLADVRRQSHLSQEELADLAGLHWTEVALLEQGDHLPQGDAVSRLASAMQVAEKDLLAGIRWVPHPGGRGGDWRLV